jgi:2-iminobutanoate/2-iminopropanoate deaminase
MNSRKTLIATISITIVLTVACAPDERTERTYFQLPEMAALNLPFSDAVLVGDTLYLSGNGGIDLETMQAPEDPKAEAELLMQNFKNVLAMADMSLDDLVSVTVYCPDLSLYGDFNEVYRSHFDGDFPARAFLGSGPLLFGMRFEMQAIAAR